MTCGLRQAGIDVIAGIDIDKDAKETYEYNNPGSIFINSDIKQLQKDYFEQKFGIQRYDDYLILVGCSPCQFYSIINTDKKRSLNSKDLLKNFSEFIEYYMPGYILVENVPGIMTHKSSVLPYFLQKIKDLGYKKLVYKIVNMSHYGVPQSRKRFSLIATRLENVTVKLPDEEDKEAILSDYIGEKNGFPKISAGHRDFSSFNHTTAGLSDVCLKRLMKTRHDGGSRLDWAKIYDHL